MEDATILGRIHELVDEEHRLREQVGTGEISTDEEHKRLTELEVALDQCWDLLRRRRSARQLGNDPDEVEPRAAQQVENYLQ
ncbi:MAG TPA: DUF2630 family protein [Catenuloplanes sp.]|jgi:hypothetical protein